jgi:hypothetical protein
MRWGALMVCVAAACGGGTGVDIDIFVPDGVKVDRVELWVAYDYCSDCPNGIAWNQSDRATGNIYFLRDEGLIKAEARDGRFVLHLVAAAGNSDPPWVAIVGYEGGKATAVRVLRDVHIPTSKVVIWQVDLHPAADASTDVDMPPADATRDHRVHVWNRAPTSALPEPTGCLAYQRWDGSTWKTEYFVPKSDPDCDGIPPEKECSEYWYQYKPIGGCITNQAIQLPGSCVIGLSPCADGVTSDKTCGADPTRPLTCLPDAFCHDCGDQIPADTCIAQSVGDSTLVHFDCSYPATDGGAPCTEEHALVQMPFTQALCGSPVLHYVEKPFTEPQGSLVFGTSPAQVKFTAKPSAGGPCLIDIVWTGGTTETFKDGITFLLDVPYDNATRTIVPVTVSPSNQTIVCGTTAPTQCVPSGPNPDGVAGCSRL